MKTSLWIALWGSLLAGRAFPQAAAPSEGIEFFEKRIRPVLVDKCYGCHSEAAGKVKAELRVDTREGLRRGGESGPAIVPGEPDKSLLIKAIRYTDEDLEMPPKEADRLTSQQVTDFVAWVKMGAPDPRTGDAAAPARKPALDVAAARSFWSLRPVRDPAPPAVKDTDWSWTPVDRFVLARLEEKGLQPTAEADRRSLLRRATFDLIGLPPSPEEVEAFLADRSPDAFAKVVDRLLASRHYGERWGRHWLDVVRYADTAGDNSDYPVPQAYRYRNYVIEAFNRDLPYDQFIREQLAGDLLPYSGEEERRTRIVATGYVALSRRFGSQINGYPQHLTIEDTIDNLGRTFLGLTINCTRCHDHKFDPITNEDYYALYGIFNSTRYPFPGIELDKVPRDLVPLVPQAEVDRLLKPHQARMAALGDEVKKLEAEKTVAQKTVQEYDEAKRAFEARKDEERKAEAAQLAEDRRRIDEARAREKAPAAREAEAARRFDELDAALAQARKARAMLEAEVRRLERERAAVVRGAEEARALKDLEVRAAGARTRLEELKAPIKEAIRKREEFAKQLPVIDSAYAVAEGPKPGNVQVHVRGEPKNLGKEVPRRFLEVLGGQALAAGAPGSGRLELAGWIADPANPLTARVMVNRIWQYHFGRGIVATASDFGTRGTPPTHPELLDYLAARFVEDGWSVKSMHRRIMLSRTYRLASRGRPEQAKVDPAGEWLWRFPSRRLEAEAVRDAMLAVSGALDRTPGGPHPFPPQSTWGFTQHRPFVEVYPSDRRSVYLMTQRIRKHPFFATFDGPDTNASTAERKSTTTPLQALFLMNDPFVHEQAAKFAARLLAERSDDGARIERAYLLAFARPPSSEERRRSEAYLRDLRDRLAAAGSGGEAVVQPAWESFARVLFRSNEFVYVD